MRHKGPPSVFLNPETNAVCQIRPSITSAARATAPSRCRALVAARLPACLKLQAKRCSAPHASLNPILSISADIAFFGGSVTVGMGVVYLAARDDDQFKKLVAIKVIKRGMDSEAILHRFEQERKVLAALNRPNVARLLDGGATEDGRPYFVMAGR